MRFIIPLILLIAFTKGRETDYCFANDDNPYLQFATKTAYTIANSGAIRYQTIPNCRPLQIWMMARHGIRYPEAEVIAKFSELPRFRDQIMNNHERSGNGRLCNNDLQNFQNWSPNVNLTRDMERKLTPEGMEESRLLAKRIQSAFPELLQPHVNDINSENYVFTTTKTPRGQGSMDAFIEGLFGRKTAVTPIENDLLLTAYKNCTRWHDGDENDSHYTAERNKFINGSEFTKLITDVSRRLGFYYNLSSDTIQNMYDACRYEKAFAVSNLSPWCAAFNRDELKLLEYLSDLNYYYGAGYGREVNKLIGCFPLQDMFKNFRDIERGDTNGKPKGIFYFAQSLPLLTFFTSMDIAKDSQPLLASNYGEMKKRHWRTSAINPFNSNFIAVFYRCSDTNSPNKVMFYLQEKPLHYEGCQVGLCDWEYLKSKLGDAADQCSIDRCSGSGASANQIIMILIPVLLLHLIYFK